MRLSDHPSDQPSDAGSEPLAEPVIEEITEDVTEEMPGEMCSSAQIAHAADRDGRSLGVAPPPLALPTLRFVLHRDTPLWRFGH